MDAGEDELISQTNRRRLKEFNHLEVPALAHLCVER